ncbi:MAG: spore germination protein [Selenomonadales bacterium]|nr:spore germination protein [Selenomonadales bacterium]
MLTEKKPIDRDLEKNAVYLKEVLGVGVSFDVIYREFHLGNKRIATYGINGMNATHMITDALKSLFPLPSETHISADVLRSLFVHKMAIQQAKIVQDLNEAIINLLAGELLFLIDGEDALLSVDARMFPARTPAESTLEKVTRGSKDSFIETLVFNTALIRRRLRDPNLRFEIVKVGSRSQTDVAIAYIADVTNPDLVDDVRRKLKDIDIDGIPMAERAVEEYIVEGTSLDVIPKVRYTERPDVAALHLLEGHVCLMVDTSPNVMILPTTFWHHVQHAEEYHQTMLVGTFLKVVRLIGIFFSLLLPPVWLVLAMNSHILPEALLFLGPKEPGIIPIAIQFLLAELGLELVRMATIHVPSAQATALGFIGAFMLGEFATKVGLFGNEIVFYIAVAAVGSFATPSVEFAMALRMFRLFLIVVTGLFHLPGFLIAMLIVLLIFVRTKSFGVPYLWPLIPWDWQALKSVLFRLPITDDAKRLSVLKPQKENRMEK